MGGVSSHVPCSAVWHGNCRIYYFISLLKVYRSGPVCPQAQLGRDTSMIMQRHCNRMHSIPLVRLEMSTKGPAKPGPSTMLCETKPDMYKWRLTTQTKLSNIACYYQRDQFFTQSVCVQAKRAILDTKAKVVGWGQGAYVQVFGARCT